MTDPIERSGLARLRRIGALLALGISLALVVLQIRGVIRHEVEIHLAIPPDVLARIERLEIDVLEAQESIEPVVYADFRAPDPARLSHKFNLMNGQYFLVFRIHLAGYTEPLFVRRTLDVQGEAQVRFDLP